MEFGHNDQKQKGPGKGAYYSFMTSLKTFIDEARARGAYPVLVVMPEFHEKIISFLYLAQCFFQTSCGNKRIG